MTHQYFPHDSLRTALSYQPTDKQQQQQQHNYSLKQRVDCQVCFDKIDLHCTLCSAEICLKCFIEWAVEQSKGMRQLDYFICPDSQCRQIHEYSSVVNLRPSTPLIEKLQTSLIQRVIKCSKDIIKCPYCDLSVWLSPEDFKGCPQIQCSQCNSVFKQGDVHEDTMELAVTYISKIFYCKACPKCGTEIQKNGGCSHLVCVVCNFEQCWYCGQNYMLHNDKTCISNYFTKQLTYAAVFFCSIYQVGISMILQRICTDVIYFIQQFLVYNIFALLFYLFVMQISSYMNAEKTSKLRKKGITYSNLLRKSAVSKSIVLIVLQFLYLKIVQIKDSNLTEISVFLGMELFVMVSALMVFKVVQFAYQYYLTFVV